MESLANELQIPGKNSRSTEEVVKDIYNSISKSGKSTLFVFDNAPDHQSCKSFLPILSHPKMKKPVILITSRNQEWRSSTGTGTGTGKIHVLSLNIFTTIECSDFVMNHMDISDSYSPEFVELVGGLPLALQQSLAYVKQEKSNRKGYTLTDFVQGFKSLVEKFLSAPGSSLLGKSTLVEIIQNEMFPEIQSLQKGEQAIKILDYLSFLRHDKIPLSFVSSLLQLEPHDSAQSLNLLEKCSLIKQHGNFLTIDRQLQFVILQSLQQNTDTILPVLIKKCVEALKTINRKHHFLESDENDNHILLNIHEITINQFSFIPMTKEFLDFKRQIAFVLFEKGRFEVSFKLYEKVMTNYQKMLGECHYETLDVQNALAMKLLKRHRCVESFNLLQDALQKAEGHPDLDPEMRMGTKHNISKVLRKQRKYKESLKLLQELLPEETEKYGENHPLVFQTHFEIAELCILLRDFSRAFDLYQALEIKQTEILGPNHRDVLCTRQSHATGLYLNRKLDEATEMLKDVYEKRKEALGERHEDTRYTLWVIAKIFGEQGRTADEQEIRDKLYESRGVPRQSDYSQPATLLFEFQ